MRAKFILLSAVSMGLLFNSCSKQEVADETITYEVIISNPNRPCSIRYINDTGGEDLAVLNTSKFSKEYTIKSSATKQDYSISVNCYSEYVEDGTYTNFQPQTITVNILEDGVVKSTKTKSGSSTLYISSYDVTASLPTAVKYK